MQPCSLLPPPGRRRHPSLAKGALVAGLEVASVHGAGDPQEDRQPGDSCHAEPGGREDRAKNEEALLHTTWQGRAELTATSCG